MHAIASALFAPGLFSSPPVGTALVVGAIVALVSGVVGFFVVIRGQAFLGHALGDMGATGASGAALVGVGALWGFLAGGLAAGSTVDLLGGHEHERDATTGIVLAAMLGLSALFLYLITSTSTVAGTAQTILFGSAFTIDPSVAPVMAGLSAATLALVGAIYRPLLYSSISPEAARAKGIPVRLVGLLFVIAVAAAAEQSAMVVGSLVSTALLVGPAAAATRLARQPGTAVALSVLLSLAVMWLSIILAYDSYDWGSGGRGWPVSFFVTALVLLLFVLSYLRRPRRTVVHGAARGAEA